MWINNIFFAEEKLCVARFSDQFPGVSLPIWNCDTVMTLARFCLYGGGGGLVAKLCPTLCNSMDCSPPGSSVHGISQARILEWVASSFSRGSSQPRNRTHVSSSAGRLFTAEPPGKPFYPYRHYSNLFW